MIVHTGPARKTITLDDGSVWSWKGGDLGGGDYWLSGADFPAHMIDPETDHTPHHARRADPIRYYDGKPLTDSERAGLAAIISGATHLLR